MYFCIKKYTGTQGEVCRQLKIFYPLPPTPPVVYATDRLKAVVPVLFVFCVALWFILRGASCFKVYQCSLSSCFVIPFGIVITSPGEEGAGLCDSRAFVFFFVRVSFCRFSLPFGVGGRLRFVIVALLYFYINLFGYRVNARKWKHASERITQECIPASQSAEDGKFSRRG